MNTKFNSSSCPLVYVGGEESAWKEKSVKRVRWQNVCWKSYASCKPMMNVDNSKTNDSSRVTIIFFQKLKKKKYIYIYSSTATIYWKFSRLFGSHPDSFISDDVCNYSQPRFDATRRSDKSLRVYWKFFLKIFVAATEYCRRNKSHKFSLILFFSGLLQRNNFVAETKIFTKILQYTHSDLLLRRVASPCCCN